MIRHSRNILYRCIVGNSLLFGFSSFSFALPAEQQTPITITKSEKAKVETSNSKFFDATLNFSSADQK